MLKFQTIGHMPLNQSNAPTNQLLTDIASAKFVQNVLLVGPNGSGKSTLARHLPIWFQASRGEPEGTLHDFIDVPNDLKISSLKTMCSLVSMNPTGYDWIVLDEVDKSSDRNLFNKLHGILEFNPQKVFILTANSIAAIPNGILSRCMPINIVAPRPSEYLPYAQTVLANRGVIKSNAFVLSALQGASVGGDDCRKYEHAISMI